MTGAKDGSVKCWDPAANSAAPFVAVPEPVKSWGLAFFPDSQSLLALTESEGAVVRWDTPKAQVKEALAFLGANHTALDLSPEGRWLALGDAAGNVQIWDFPQRQIVTNLTLSERRVDVLFFSPRGNFLACASLGPGIPQGRLWAVAGWHEVNLEGIRLEGGFQAVLSPDEQIFAGGYTDGKAAWYDLKTRQLIPPTFDSPNAGAVWVAFSPDGRLFLTGGLVDGRLTVWNTARRRPRSIGRVFRNGLQHVIFSPDSRRLVTAGASPKDVVKVWDAQTGRDVATLPGEFWFINHLIFSPDGDTLFAASREGMALLWHAPSFAEIAQREAGRGGAW